MSHPQLPYTYESPLFVKLSSLPLLLLLVFVFADLKEFSAMWAKGGAVFRSVILLIATGWVAALGEVFVRKTVFTEEGIRHRTRLGTSYFKQYGQVVSFDEASTVRVVFDDGSKIKFEGGEARKVSAVLLLKAPHARHALRA
ncbi:MAG TPA: hypothetical protein VM914_02845 [Pyrinomonadaceae bacterium]|jgi:hypothetical protein|nr:hypothetical protein [Pyrinomonadaceae bacterium]